MPDISFLDPFFLSLGKLVSILVIIVAVLIAARIVRMQIWANDEDILDVGRRDDDDDDD